MVDKPVRRCDGSGLECGHEHRQELGGAWGLKEHASQKLYITQLNHLLSDSSTIREATWGEGLMAVLSM